MQDILLGSNRRLLWGKKYTGGGVKKYKKKIRIRLNRGCFSVISQ